MTFSETVDQFLRRHPRMFLVGSIILAVIAIIVILGGFRDVGLVYKAF